MSKKEKLIERLIAVPSDFTWTELVSVLQHFGYRQRQGDGSRVKFDNGNPNDMINLHKPHPGSIVKRYALEMVIEKLKNAGYL
ncbi:MULTISPECIES: type II toxin-antitoxin system HicA family toxin [Methylocaldum]|uniref:type II toxin-antitoxin system HicA family toxin n=1 Tax=unclassified Methylocaldum TaxID=2622260 RepID=UPI00098B780A|nr:type II toxin-antitoxin system HicA family toxin [Methylocaldum sp. BRCS4]